MLVRERLRWRAVKYKNRADAITLPDSGRDLQDFGYASSADCAYCAVKGVAGFTSAGCFYIGRTLFNGHLVGGGFLGAGTPESNGIAAAGRGLVPEFNLCGHISIDVLSVYSRAVSP
jgi:hypothetical protein